MGLETDKDDFNVPDLNPLWPLEDDEVGKGDDHLRLIKKALKYAWDNNLFPGVGGGGGGSGYSTGDIRYTSVDKDDASVQAPDFLFASGQPESRTEYPDLFDKIGTRFGDGDGTTTFNMPNVNDGFIPADVGIFTLGNTNGLPSDILTGPVRSNPITGSLITQNIRTKWWHYRQKGSPVWEVFPFPDGISSVSWAVADIIEEDVVVLVCKTSTSSSVRARRFTWKLGESSVWTDEGEVSTKPNETSSEQNLNFENIVITPDGSLEVIQAVGSANIYLRRPETDGEWFIRSTTTANNETTNQNIAITSDGTKILRTARYYASEYTVGLTKPWEGSFADLPRAGDTNALEAIEYAEGDAVFVAKRGIVFFYDKVNGIWVEYSNTISSGTVRSMAYDGTTGQLVIMGTSDIYRMSAGAASPRVMGYVKT